MDCEQGLLLINARLDGELPAGDRHRLTVHLGECTSCRLAVDEFERDDRELSRIFGARQRSAAAVADRVLEAWFKEAPPISRRWGGWGLTSAAAAGLALALILLGTRAWPGSSRGDQDGRVQALVDEWTQGDASYETELRLRSKGPACVVPLADVVRSWVGEADDAKRLAAARLLCDLAEASQIPTLIELLDDDSTEVRALSEASLVRLTGRNGVDPLGPALPLATTCSNPQVEWRQWWEDNKERFERSDP